MVCEVWYVRCEVWYVRCEVWYVRCGTWGVRCEATYVCLPVRLLCIGLQAEVRVSGVESEVEDAVGVVEVYGLQKRGEHFDGLFVGRREHQRYVAETWRRPTRENK